MSSCVSSRCRRSCRPLWLVVLPGWSHRRRGRHVGPPGAVATSSCTPSRAGRTARPPAPPSGLHHPDHLPDVAQRRQRDLRTASGPRPARRARRSAASAPKAFEQQGRVAEALEAGRPRRPGTARRARHSARPAWAGRAGCPSRSRQTGTAGERSPTCCGRRRGGVVARQDRLGGGVGRTRRGTRRPRPPSTTSTVACAGHVAHDLVQAGLDGDVGAHDRPVDAGRPRSRGSGGGQTARAAPRRPAGRRWRGRRRRGDEKLRSASPATSASRSPGTAASGVAAGAASDVGRRAERRRAERRWGRVGSIWSSVSDASGLLRNGSSSCAGDRMTPAPTTAATATASRDGWWRILTAATSSARAGVDCRPPQMRAGRNRSGREPWVVARPGGS